MSPMIGRFSQLGKYQELLQSRDFLLASFAGALALASLRNGADNPKPSSLACLAAAVESSPVWDRSRPTARANTPIQGLWKDSTQWSTSLFPFAVDGNLLHFLSPGPTLPC
jgi:hypothetical protein